MVIGDHDAGALHTINFLANAVDDGRVIVGLLVAGQPLALVEQQRGLRRRTLALAGFGDRRNELGAPALVANLAGGLAAVVEFSVPRRVLVGRVHDRSFEERVIHGGPPPVLNVPTGQRGQCGESPGRL